MAFLSGSFGRADDYPQLLRAIGDVLPLKYLLDAINAIYLHGEADLGRAAPPWPSSPRWGAFGMLVAMRKFRWEPREG